MRIGTIWGCLIFCLFRSIVYVNGSKVVDNDGNTQSGSKKCGSITLASGSQSIYIEGWAQSSALSMLATYQGPDTLGQEMSIPAASSPLAPSSLPPSFTECSTGGNSGDSNFTICAFKASNEIDLNRVDDVHAYYVQVCATLVRNEKCLRAAFINSVVAGKGELCG